jgi:copper chaperone NosL
MNAISKASQYLLVFAGICILGAIFFPIWRIELDAPQYPEGLKLLIFANKMGGDVDIINGLNHYIGMKTIHAEEFIEFTVLPYIFAFFAAFSFVVSYFKNRKALLFLLITFFLFGVLAMFDFWWWEYEYGHNLDPTAAIIVPGMAYQPPLIGFKQLLNFGAFSIPDIGGWTMLSGGIIIFFCYAFEAGWLKKFIKSKASMLFFLPLFISSCQPDGPEQIVINKDLCTFCKMTISDPLFGAEVITKKGRIYKFDDLSCLLRYIKENKDMEIQSHYVCNYLGQNELISAETASYIKGGGLKSPMAGNIAAFVTKAQADEQGHRLGAESTDWKTLTIE